VRTLRLQLTGDLDVVAAPAEFQRLIEGTQAGDRVELDLGAVKFADSSGISMLISAKTHFDGVGTELVLVNPSPPVSRLLMLTGLTDTFAIHDETPEPSGA
jgi:anti-anti-sigma factor